MELKNRAQGANGDFAPPPPFCQFGEKQAAANGAFIIRLFCRRG
jgi:hypothetical protein